MRREDEEKEKKNNKNNRNSSCRPQQKSNHRLHQVADYQPRDHLKEKEHKYSSFCWSSQFSRRWTMKLYFHPLDLTALNSWILLSAYGAKYTDRDLRVLLVRN